MIEKDGLWTFLKSLGKCPVLTRSEEIELAFAVQRMLRLKESKDLSEEDIKAIREGERARQCLYKSNIKLVIYVCKTYKFVKGGLEFADLIQEGCLGLSKAIDKFDPAKGNKFSTYAHWWITQAIQRSIANNRYNVRRSLYLYERLAKIKNVIRRISIAEGGRRASAKEIASFLGWKEEIVRETIVACSPEVSLERKLLPGSDSPDEVLDAISLLKEDYSYLGYSPEEYAIQEERKSLIERAMKSLTPLEKEVIVSRFGLDGQEPQTLQEVGEKVGKTKESVRKYQDKALAKLNAELGSAVAQHKFNRSSTEVSVK